MLTASLLLSCGVLWSMPFPQEPPATTKTPDRALVRAAADLRKVTAVTAAHDHTFAGRCTYPSLDQAEPAVPFTIARRADLDWLRLGKHVVVQLGTAQLVQDSGPPWRQPEGDAPDLPLEPLALLHHTTTGELLRAEPCSHADRPAQRAVLQWSGTDARRLLEQVSVPCTRSQRLLEQFDRFFQEPAMAKNLIVDGSLTYDPATHTLFACSLRIALLQLDVEPTSEQPAPPAGLSPLLHRIGFQLGFELTRIDAPPVAWPAFAATDRKQLIDTTRR
jgi:hypothetical protein